MRINKAKPVDSCVMKERLHLTLPTVYTHITFFPKNGIRDFILSDSRFPFPFVQLAAGRSRMRNRKKNSDPHNVTSVRTQHDMCLMMKTPGEISPIL